jgi:hypothetical protein
MILRYLIFNYSVKLLETAHQKPHFDLDTKKNMILILLNLCVLKVINYMMVEIWH